MTGETDRSRIERLFLTALELSVAEREEFLAAECAGDPEMIPILREMLEGEQRSRDVSPWDRPVWESAVLRFGPYRVTGRIGAGGMGVVYEAIRDDDEFHKRVAIKTISPALLTDYGARKLRAERQILAALEHPNIARLLDGGTTPEGLPYVVMEYIEGEPLTRYAESRKLGTEQRLRLFLEVCAAVEFAHANLVVHADLKPGNILITRGGSPKLLDFGLARLIGRADATVVGALTPDYASPEQAAGGVLTTASDVYSLGVLLHELTTGSLPGRDDGAPKKRRGDLDVVIGMALRRAPADRYRSVSALADDIRRVLENYPVHARAESLTYRARKYARRHRIAAAAAVLLTASVAVGAAANYRESQRTRRHFEEVRQLAHSLLFDTYDAIADLPGATLARKNVVTLANVYLDRLSTDAGTDVDVRKELAISYRRLGEIRGWPYLSNLGDTAGAFQNFRQAEDLLQSCLRGRGADASLGIELAKTENGLGVILVREGNPYEAQKWQALALSRLNSLLRADPGNLRYRRELAGTEIYLGQAFFIQGTRDRALEPARSALQHYTAAAEVDAALLRATPSDPEAVYQTGRATVYIGYAHWLLAELGDTGDHNDAALTTHRRAMEFEVRAQAMAPTNGRYARGLLDLRADVARSLWRTGEKRLALSMLPEVVRGTEARASREPENREAQFDYAQAADAYAEWLAETADEAGARRWADRAFAVYARILKSDPANEEAARASSRLQSVLAHRFAGLAPRR